MVLARYFAPPRKSPRIRRHRPSARPWWKSNPVTGPSTRSRSQPGSSARRRIAALLPGADVVKAFNTTFAAPLAAGTHGGQPLDVLITPTPSTPATRRRPSPVTAGLRPLQVGGLSHARDSKDSSCASWAAGSTPRTRRSTGPRPEDHGLERNVLLPERAVSTPATAVGLQLHSSAFADAHAAVGHLGLDPLQHGCRRAAGAGPVLRGVRVDAQQDHFRGVRVRPGTMPQPSGSTCRGSFAGP